MQVGRPARATEFAVEMNSIGGMSGREYGFIEFAGLGSIGLPGNATFITNIR